MAGLANSARQLATVAATLGLGITMQAQTAHIDINAAAQGTPVSPILYGIFFEEINHAGDGGLYAELVRNRSFEDADTPQAWTVEGDGARIAIDTAHPLHPRNPRSLRWEIAGSASLVNEGYWGIAVQSGKRYRFTMYARCDGQFRGALTVSLQSADGQVYAQRTLRGFGKDWKLFSATLTANGTDPKARLVLTANGDGALWLDMVSLMPVDTFKRRPNGLGQTLRRCWSRSSRRSCASQAGASWRSTACTTPCAGATRLAMSPNDLPAGASGTTPARKGWDCTSTC